MLLALLFIVIYFLSQWRIVGPEIGHPPSFLFSSFQKSKMQIRDIRKANSCFIKNGLERFVHKIYIGSVCHTNGIISPNNKGIESSIHVEFLVRNILKELGHDDRFLVLRIGQEEKFEQSLSRRLCQVFRSGPCTGRCVGRVASYRRRGERRWEVIFCQHSHLWVKKLASATCQRRIITYTARNCWRDGKCRRLPNQRSSS